MSLPHDGQKRVVQGSLSSRSVTISLMSRRGLVEALNMWLCSIYQPNSAGEVQWCDVVCADLACRGSPSRRRTAATPQICREKSTPRRTSGALRALSMCQLTRARRPACGGPHVATDMQCHCLYAQMMLRRLASAIDHCSKPMFLFVYPAAAASRIRAKGSASRSRWTSSSSSTAAAAAARR